MLKEYKAPEVYTSYVGRVPALLKVGFRREEMSLIVRKRLPFVDKRIRNCTSLAPAAALLEGYKKGTIDEFSYRVLYRDWLDSHIDAAGTIETIRKLGLKVFLCYETPEKFCHRHIFAEWLSANGLQCEEWAPTFEYHPPKKAPVLPIPSAPVVASSPVASAALLAIDPYDF